VVFRFWRESAAKIDARLRCALLPQKRATLTKRRATLTAIMKGFDPVPAMVAAANLAVFNTQYRNSSVCSVTLVARYLLALRKAGKLTAALAIVR